MQFFKLIFSLGFLLPFCMADGAAIAGAIQNIVEDSIALNATIASYNGEILKLIKILSASTALQNTIKDATATAEDSEPLNALEAITIAGETQALAGAVQSSLDTIVAKKPVFKKNLLQPAILLTLKQQSKLSDEFSAAVSEKLPEELRELAGTLVQPIKDAFAAAIAEYKNFF